MRDRRDRDASGSGDGTGARAAAGRGPARGDVAWRDRRDVDGAIDVVPWVVFLILVAGIAYAAGRMEQLALLGVEARLGHEAEQSARQLEQFMESRLDVVKHVRRLFETGRVRSREEFLELSTSLQVEVEGFQALSFVDRDGVIRWVVPETRNQAAVGLDLERHPVAGPWLRRAREQDRLVVTPPLELAQGGLGVTCYLPVERDGEFVGFLNGVFRFDDVLERCFGARRPQDPRIRVEDGRMLGTVGRWPADDEPSARGEAVARVGEREWRVQTGEPFDGVVAGPLGRRVYLATGVVLAALVSILVGVARRQRRRIERSERRYRLIVDTTREGVVVLGSDGRVRFANDRMAELLGESGDRLPGRAIADFVAPEHRDELERLWRSTRDAGVGVGDLTIVCADGTRRIAVFSTSALVDAGRSLGTLAMVSDVTERRRLEGDLRQSQKMEAVGRLAGGVAHDFNNMLVVILGACDLLEEHLGHEPAARRLLGEVVAAGERGAALTRRLLSFSRKDVVRPQDIDVGEALQGLEPVLRRVIGEDVHMEFRVAAGPLPVRMDVTQFEQVVLNLVINAREALPRGGRIRVTAERRGDDVELEVQDSGPGIPRADRDRVFEPFFTTKGGMGGTGLGLSTAHGIVVGNGGSMEVGEGELGGALLRVRLPANDTRAEPAAPERSEGGRGRGEVILLVEDEAPVREVLRAQLCLAGYEVVTAAGVVAARERLAAGGGTVDLVLTDVVMPDGNGVDLAREVRREAPATRVLLISGYLDGRGLDGPLPAPLIRKPFTNRELLAAVRRELDAGASSADARRAGASPEGTDRR